MMATGGASDSDRETDGQTDEETHRKMVMRRSMSVPNPPPMKNKLFTSLYRLRYGWSFGSSVQVSNNPLMILGKIYIPDKDVRGHSEGVPPHVVQFLDHFYSIPWITYRCNFPPISPTNLTTDCGWGCMVRSGQMLLATTLHLHLLGKDWRLANSDVRGHTVHRQILSWFGDAPLSLFPFSIHRMMDTAILHGNQPGDWFGPSQVAVLIRDCVKRALREHINLQKLNIYVSHDCTVYVGDVLDIFNADLEQSLLVMVPVRLGSESLNPIYIPCVKSLLALDHSVGIIGGKPKHSVFFVGYQDDNLIHLDPHYSQTTVDMTRPDFDVSTYHCRTPKKIPVAKMDPSCTLGFYCHTLEDFSEFQKQAEKVLAPPMQKGYYPFFSFSNKRLAEIITPDINISMIEHDGDNTKFMGSWSEKDGFVMLDYVPIEGDDPQL